MRKWNLRETKQPDRNHTVSGRAVIWTQSEARAQEITLLTPIPWVGPCGPLTVWPLLLNQSCPLFLVSGLRVSQSLHVAGRMLQCRSPRCPHSTLWPEGRSGRSSESGSREAMGSNLMWIQPSNQYWPPPTSTAHAPSLGPPPAYCPAPNTQPLESGNTHVRSQPSSQDSLWLHLTQIKRQSPPCAHKAPHRLVWSVPSALSSSQTSQKHFSSGLLHCSLPRDLCMIPSLP